MQTAGHVERAVIRTLVTVSERVLSLDGKQQENPSLHRTAPKSTDEIMDHLFRLSDEPLNEDSTRASVSRATARLEAKGLVEQVEHDEIADPRPRVHYWRLNDAGQKEARRIINSYADALQTLKRRHGGTW